MTTLLTAALPTRSESIEECRQLAEANYPLVQRYDIIRQTEQFTLSNIAKGWLPQIGAYAQGTGQNVVPELPDALTSVLRMQGYDPKGIAALQYRAGIDVQQTLYDGGCIEAAQQVARAQAAVETAKNDVDLYALRHRVEEVCFGWLLVEERLRQNDELQQLLSANVRKLQALYDGGVAMGADVDAVKAELASARQQATELQSVRSSLQEVLSLLCGQRVESVAKPAAPAYNAGAVRPELHLFDAQLSLCDARERSLHAQLMPRLGLFVQGYYGYTGFNMFHDMLHRNPSFNALVGARLTWNISPLYTRRNDARRLQAQRSDIDAARQTFVFNQALQSTEGQQRILRYEHLLDDDNEIIALRRSVRQASEAKLDGGIIDVNALLQDVSREHQAVINRSIHEIEHLKAIYELQNTLGK